MLAADWLLVPVFPSAYDLDGLEKLKDIRKKIASRYNPRLNFLGVLLGLVDVTAKLDQHIFDMLKDAFAEKVFRTKITASVRQREAPLYGRTIIEHVPEHKSADQFRELAREAIARLEQSTEVALSTQDSRLIANERT